MSHSKLPTLIFTLFLLLASRVNSQSLKSYDKVEIQTLYINAKDSMVRFQVLSENKNNKYIPSLTYFWYKSNAILKTVGGADGRLLNGDYVCFYTDNNLKEKGKFNKGLKDETWMSWNADGKKREQVTWKKGVKNGVHLVFNNEGNVVTIEKYKNGVLQVKKEKKVKKVVQKEAQVKPANAKNKEAPAKPMPTKKKGK